MPLTRGDISRDFGGEVTIYCRQVGVKIMEYFVRIGQILVLYWIMITLNSLVC